jgi:hypothetical protein
MQNNWTLHVSTIVTLILTYRAIYKFKDKQPLTELHVLGFDPGAEITPMDSF